MKSIRTVLVALIAITTLLVFSVQAYFILSQFKQFSAKQIETNLLRQAEKEANNLYKPIGDNGNDAAHIAAVIGSMDDYNETLTFRVMKKILADNEIFSGFSIAFEPGVVTPETKFYLPYIVKDKNNTIGVDWSYNGPQYFEKSWYKLGMSTGKKYDISSPYQDYKGIMWISVVAPIIHNDKRIGVATADVVIDSLCEYVAKLKVGEKGYAYLITADGTYLGKDKEKAPDHDNVSDDLDPQGKALGKVIVAGEQAGVIRLENQKQFIAYAPIGETGLKLVLVYMEEEILGELNHTLIINGIIFMITVMIYIGIVIYVINRRMVNPLRKLAQLVNRVGKGEITPFTMKYQHEDEIGLVYTNFQEMLKDLQRAQQDLEDKRTRLTRKNAELERFTYTVSHDLRSPLITIKGFAGMIRREIEKGKYNRVQGDLQRIENAADKMAELLEGLLELSRIGRIANKVEEIPMTELTKKIVELLHEGILAKNIQLEIQEDMPKVFGDRNRIGEVIQNLIENGIKFMDKTEGKIKVGYLLMNEEPVYFVKDNGVGIDPQYHTKIFGLFDKLDTNGEGSGIGLALVKRIVEYHSGKIWVASEPGQGACFFFTIKTTSAGFQGSVQIPNN